MKFSDLILLCLLVVASAAAVAQDNRPGPGFEHIQSVDVPYESDPDTHGLGYAVLSGDPDEAGIYVIRLNIPPGLIFSPHSHDQDRHVTVISGVWETREQRLAVAREIALSNYWLEPAHFPYVEWVTEALEKLDKGAK